MKYMILGCVLAATATCAQATEYGKVVSSVPVISQVVTPQRNCWQEDVVVREPRSYGGSVVGGVMGALVGNAFGRGSGKTAATAAGAVLGAVAGSAADGPRSDVQTIRRCETTQTSEQRTVGYDVTYEYAGQRYTTRMASDPGEWVPIRVSVDDPASRNVSSSTGTTTVYTEPARVTTVIDEPVVVYRPAPVYVEPPVRIGVDFGYHYWGGHYSHGYRRY